MLVLARQAQLLAEMHRVLVDSEAWRRRGDLEQDPLRLAEVDRVEVVAVDYRRDAHAALRHALLPREVVVVERVPVDVVDRPRALDAALRGFVVPPVEMALVALQPVLTLGELREPERLRQGVAAPLDAARGVGAGALHSEDPLLRRDLGMLRAQRRVPLIRDHELEAEPV